VRRGRRTFVPAYVHTPAKRVHHLRLIGSIFELGKGSHWPAFVFTHWVSVPNPRKPAPGLDQTAIAGSELLFLGCADREGDVCLAGSVIHNGPANRNSAI
jgi:hypothetical protein